MSLPTQVYDVCNVIYHQLGAGHSEVVYQTALVLELYNLGATSVESEKHVPVFFTDTRGVQHTIGNERIDIFARFPNYDGVVLLIELKAVANMNRTSVEHQIFKYMRSLQHLKIIPTHKLAINFPQQPDKKTVDFISF
jgi:GxxExxY protein